jgi:hypothetical protein
MYRLSRYEVVFYHIYYGVPAAQLAYMRSSLTEYVTRENWVNDE